MAGVHEIVVDSSNDRAFQYWHLRCNVALGEEVVAEHTVLGWIQQPFDHVHLGEIDDHRDQNPLARGHLEPYADHTTPRAIALDLSNGPSPELTEGGLLSRSTTSAIEAIDEPAMPVPGPFAACRQTPALVEWRLRTGPRWSIWHIAADFRQTVPTSADFWQVYAAGTDQNSPVFDRRLTKGLPASTCSGPTSTPAGPPGLDELEARVADIRGNSSTTTWSLEIQSPVK